MPKNKHQKSLNTGKIQIIYGIHAVTAALLNTKRIHEELHITEKNNEIGELRSGVYSPHFGKVIGIAMILKPYWNNSQSFKIELNSKSFDVKVCDLPFI